MNKVINKKIEIKNISIKLIKLSKDNPRKWTKEQAEYLKQSIQKFGLVDPLIVNSSQDREGIVIGGNMRLKILQSMDFKEVPVVYLDLTKEQEQELNLRLNKNGGEFDYEILSNFQEELLKDVGFSSEEIDNILLDDELDKNKTFDLDASLKKIGISEIKVKEGDIYQLGNHRLMCGSSLEEKDFSLLMDNQKASLCMTDPPYRLKIYSRNNKAKLDGKPGYFGSMGNRAYIGTDNLEDDFTDKWMSNVKKFSKPDFSIMCFEMWRNIREIWNCMEKLNFKVRNMLVWHTPNRCQGFSAKFRFLSKHDIAMIGSSGEFKENNNPENDSILQEEYETALFATNGKPHWESYGKGKRFCPTDHISHVTADEKSSGQSVVFGTKPLNILIPYIKVLSQRDDIVVEPFGGSGSTMMACQKLKRICYMMEKQPIYAEVIIRRFEIETGLIAKKLN